MNPHQYRQRSHIPDRHVQFLAVALIVNESLGVVRSDTEGMMKRIALLTLPCDVIHLDLMPVPLSGISSPAVASRHRPSNHESFR